MDTLTQQITSLIIRHRAELDKSLTEEQAQQLVLQWMGAHGFEVEQPCAPAGFEFATFGDSREKPTVEDRDTLGWTFDTLANHAAVLADLLSSVSLGASSDREVQSAVNDMQCAGKHLNHVLQELGWNTSEE